MLRSQNIWTTGGPRTLAERYKLLLQRPVTADDVAILRRTGEILSNESVWSRADTRECSRQADSWSLFCALKEASIEVTGKWDNRRVVMEEIRFVIIEVARLDMTRPDIHPLLEYNNLPTTRFEDIKKVLMIASERLAARIAT